MCGPFFIETKYLKLGYINMIRLLPTDTEQNIYIIPSTFDADIINTLYIRLTESGTKLVTDITTFTWELVRGGNNIKISFTPSEAFIKDRIYAFALRDDDNVYYRDIAYVASQTDKKEKYTLNTTYVEYEGEEDNYIIY